MEFPARVHFAWLHIVLLSPPRLAEALILPLDMHALTTRQQTHNQQPRSGAPAPRRVRLPTAIVFRRSVRPHVGSMGSAGRCEQRRASLAYCMVRMRLMPDMAWL